MAKKQSKKMIVVGGKCAAFLIKMAEDAKLREAFIKSPKTVVKSEKLSQKDAALAIKLGGRLQISLSAYWADVEGQNQQMLIYTQKAK